MLLHACCAPCVTFPLALLRSTGYSVDALFVNPNIYPADEVERRWHTLLDFGKSRAMPATRLDISHAAWLDAVSLDTDRPQRCGLCYRLRMDETAKAAKEGGYDCFTTSLLVSIYQDHRRVAEEAERASAKHGIEFLYRDFRKGYKRSREMARGQHLYMQKYCGCEFSLAEPRDTGPH